MVKISPIEESEFKKREQKVYRKQIEGVKEDVKKWFFIFGGFLNRIILRTVAPFFRRNYGRFLSYSKFDVYENDDCYELRFDVPGLTDGDVDIEISNKRVVVAMKRIQNRSNLVYSERKFGSFRRRYYFESDVDNSTCQSQIKNGELLLEVKKVLTVAADTNSKDPIFKTKNIKNQVGLSTSAFDGRNDQVDSKKTANS